MSTHTNKSANKATTLTPDGPRASQETIQERVKEITTPKHETTVEKKDGSKLVLTQVGETPAPPPPPVPLGKVTKKSDIARAYFQKCNPHDSYDNLDVNAQSEWYDRAIKATA